MLRMGMRRLAELWSTPLEDRPAHRLARILVRGGDADRTRAFRSLAARTGPPRWERFLRDPVPALRREAARAMGRAGQVAGLREALAVEACWTVRAALVLALESNDAVAELEPLVLDTRDGLRTPDRALGLGLGDGAAERALSARPASALWPRVPGDVDALERLGAVADMTEVPRLLELETCIGKRERNGWLLALGRTGDPRVLPVLSTALRRMAVDPARGFAERRLAALGLGRMGLPSLGAPLRRAFLREAEHRGTPGAGLGVQYPVRAVLIWAVGECGCVDAAEWLSTLLGDRDGNAFGGLYLQAMGALAKLGPAARPALEAVRGPGEEQAERLLARLEPR